MPFPQPLLFAALIALPALAGCRREPESAGPAEPASNAAEALPAPQAPPPMIVRTPSYRCDDGGALYISVLSDENRLTLRDRLSDVPVPLEKNAATGLFEGGGRTLSGAGDTVRYSSPQRPEQECRAAEE